MNAMNAMKIHFRRAVTHPVLAIGGTLLYGIVELLALQRRLFRR